MQVVEIKHEGRWAYDLSDPVRLHCRSCGQEINILIAVEGKVERCCDDMQPIIEMKPKVDPEIAKQCLEEAIELLDKHVVNKKSEDFDGLNEKETYFLFSMRSHLMRDRDGGRKFFCTEKQLEWLKDLVKRAADPDLTRATKMKRLKSAIKHLKREIATSKVSLEECVTELQALELEKIKKKKGTKVKK